MLDDQILNVFLVNVRACKVETTLKLVSHAECIDDGDDGIQARLALHVGSHLGYRADGLCDGAGFADAAGLDDDIVEALHLDDILQLAHKVHLQCTADATVLQGDKTIVLLVDDTTFFNEVGIDVHLADVVHDNGKLDAALIRQDSVQ